MNRREALKKAAAAGAVGWVAPTLMSSPAFAQSGVCTPKCIPAGTPQYTAAGVSGSCGGSYVVVIPITLTQGSVTCPCGGDPVAGVATLTRAFPRGTRGQQTLTESVEVSCTDLSGDPCPLVCTVTATVNITGNPGNDCAQNSVSLISLQTTC